MHVTQQNSVEFQLFGYSTLENAAQNCTYFCSNIIVLAAGLAL